MEHVLCVAWCWMMRWPAGAHCLQPGTLYSCPDLALTCAALASPSPALPRVSPPKSYLHITPCVPCYVPHVRPGRPACPLAAPIPPPARAACTACTVCLQYIYDFTRFTLGLPLPSNGSATSSAFDVPALCKDAVLRQQQQQQQEGQGQGAEGQRGRHPAAEQQDTLLPLVHTLDRE